MNVILKELERRQKQLDEYEAKVEKLAELKATTACLEKEVSETNTFELKDEIKELKDYAILLGFIEKPVAEEIVAEETVEETTQEVNAVNQPTITSI